jgi:hypothetical protein
VREKERKIYTHIYIDKERKEEREKGRGRERKREGDRLMHQLQTTDIHAYAQSISLLSVAFCAF